MFNNPDLIYNTIIYCSQPITATTTKLLNIDLEITHSLESRNSLSFSVIEKKKKSYRRGFG